jgi:hypothetical protein
MTTQDEFEEEITKATTIDEVVSIMEEKAPKKKNCFDCGQRFVGKCPIFKASPMEITTLCKTHYESLKVVSIVCCIGCECHD